MPYPAFTRAALATAFALVLPLSPAQALSTTYVASFGDDNNSCNPGSPCRFLPRAIEQTDPGGRIIVLDSATYLGTGVVITKSISIIARGVQAELAAAGQTKVIVDAGPDDVIYLDGLRVSGIHGAFDATGILFNSGAQLHVRNCIVNGFNSAGIRILAPGSSEAIISNCTIYDNKFGVWARRNGGNGALGVLVDNTTITDNTNGIKGSGTKTHIRINESKIVRNTKGLVSQNARLISFGNNVITRNGTNGQPTHNAKLK